MLEQRQQNTATAANFISYIYFARTLSLPRSLSFARNKNSINMQPFGMCVEHCTAYTTPYLLYLNCLILSISFFLCCRSFVRSFFVWFQRRIKFGTTKRRRTIYYPHWGLYLVEINTLALFNTSDPLWNDRANEQATWAHRRKDGRGNGWEEREGTTTTTRELTHAHMKQYSLVGANHLQIERQTHIRTTAASGHLSNTCTPAQSHTHAHTVYRTECHKIRSASKYSCAISRNARSIRIEYTHSHTRW